jgi:5-methylthioadenosine/S-adenosylhomocysteine deaminase
MATLGGARALGMEDQIGSLELGKRADLIVVGLAEPRLHPMFDPISHLVYAAKGADVRHVVVEGRVVVQGGEIQTLARDEVIQEADRWRARILDSLKAAGAPR